MWHIKYKILFTNICSNYHPLTFACKTSSRVILVIKTNAKLTLLRWSILESESKCNLGNIWDYKEPRRDSEFNMHFLTFSSSVHDVPIINNTFSQNFFPTCYSKLSMQTWSHVVANLNHWIRCKLRTSEATEYTYKLLTTENTKVKQIRTLRRKMYFSYWLFIFKQCSINHITGVC